MSLVSKISSFCRVCTRKRRFWIAVSIVTALYTIGITIIKPDNSSPDTGPAGYVGNHVLYFTGQPDYLSKHIVYFKHRYFIHKPKKLILLWTPMFFRWSTWDVLHEAFQHCSSHCETTTDKSRIHKADAVLFHCMDLMPWLSMPGYRRWDQVWIVWCVEPPTKIWNRLHGYRHVFNWTMHYRNDSTIFAPFGRVDKLNKSNTLFHLPQLRSQRILLLNSNCFDDIQRYKLYEELQKYLPIDYYGSCGNLSCPRGNQECAKKIDSYRFVIQFENSYCKHYVSEKYFEALHRHQIPIVNWKKGQRAINFIPNSYINIYDFKTIKDAAIYIQSVLYNQTLYNFYFDWRKHYSVHSVGVWQQFCFLCRELHDHKRPAQVIVDVHDWFTDDMCPKASVSILRKRRRSDPVLWQNPLYQQKIRKPKDNTQTPPKTSITQRLRTDLGRSVGVTSHPTGVVKPVYGYPTFPLTATAV